MTGQDRRADLRGAGARASDATPPLLLEHPAELPDADPPAPPAARPETRRRASGLLGNVPTAVVVIALLAVIAVTAVLAVGVGAVVIPPDQVLSAVGRGIDGAATTGDDFIIWQLRVPRVLEALLVGAGLAVAGVLVQVLVGNPIADPFTLGLSSGASLGAVTVITTLGIGAAAGLTLPLGAFTGAAAAGTVVFLCATSLAGLSASRLVMVGIAVGHLLSGITSFLILRTGDGEATQQVMYWLLGSLSGANWELLRIATVPVAATLATLPFLVRRLDLLALGDTTAAALGIHPGRTRVGVFMVAAVLTGTVVAISGTIGFVGLVVPNLARMLVGGLHRRILPVALLLGALLMLLADTGARMLLSPTELPVGILTAVIGVPAFVLVVRRAGRAR
ncbi:iron ABC transporter permease [Streptomyces alfalfae]|uniref:FecCD family ABC transporter permease n=1 Tax=Streptomyces alfalfae TaxID=1642299 RepID=UPI0009A15BD0|nr:iron ABC transporter permease [Streptomyces alfalfae]AYA20461.1 iron ABC transporter permease [Streptomyces fradiae]QUI29927.1 iron ABC transporter permease [Streptomyces alfalfae]RXX42826.1 iron ABC transporter permease [Streptomyces alfalfae]RZM86347.1 iron ABC transporter permease [Streptomyces alfalfae]